MLEQDIIMQGTIAKWGNSLGVRLPRHIAESAKLAEGESVNFSVEDGALVIRPTRKKFKLSDLLANYERPDAKSDEVDWGKPQGDEAW